MVASPVRYREGRILEVVGRVMVKGEGTPRISSPSNLLESLAGSLPGETLEATVGHLEWYGQMEERANESAGRISSWENAGMISGSIWRFVVRVNRSSEDPIAPDERSFGDRVVQIPQREAGISSFHFL